jgi:3-deoxy-manno-octulosonate cytidylyltransferase (CMP-KDO synthetase)
LLVLGVIPARYRSTRFPGKPLAPLGKRTMIEEVWRRVADAKRLDRVIVATDDTRIADTATAFGAEIYMTSPDHASGTDRVAEVANGVREDYALVVNVQGDEPLITSTCLDRLIAAFDGDDPPQLATLCEPIADPDDLFDPNVVKLVTDNQGRALYFSRSPIPYHRGEQRSLATDFRSELAGRGGGLSGYSRHQGIYAYSRETLTALTRLSPSTLEVDEGLEQLRALQAGFSIQVVDSDFRSMSVDTPQDLERVTRFLAGASGTGASGAAAS